MWMRIDSANALWLFLPIMSAAALIGLVLASQYAEGVYHYLGYSLTIVSVLWIFGALKSYYDAKDRGGASH